MRYLARQQRIDKASAIVCAVLAIALIVAIVCSTRDRQRYEREIRSLQWELHHDAEGGRQ